MTCEETFLNCADHFWFCYRTIFDVNVAMGFVANIFKNNESFMMTIPQVETGILSDGHYFEVICETNAIGIQNEKCDRILENLPFGHK